jgi:hypothetical protein
MPDRPPERALFCSILSYVTGRPANECFDLPDDVDAEALFGKEAIATASRITEDVLVAARAARQR